MLVLQKQADGLHSLTVVITVAPQRFSKEVGCLRGEKSLPFEQSATSCRLLARYAINQARFIMLI